MENSHFYSPLAHDIATDRLRHAAVKGVNITVTQDESNMTRFRLDLQKNTPMGNVVMAHLIGTIEPVDDTQIQITYQTHAFSNQTISLVAMVGIVISLALFFVLPTEFAPIVSAPGIAGILIVVFWSMLGTDVRQGDQFRLQELIERMLEKQTSMMTWQG